MIKKYHKLNTLTMTQFNGQLVVVTGGAGFIGSHLCDFLIANDNRVICVDNLVGNNSTKNIDRLLNNPLFTFVDSSVVDWALEADLTGVDCIFHQAASKFTVCLKDPELDLKVNALGTLRLLQAAQKYRVRKFIHASTGSVFGELANEKQDESHPKNPVSFYGVSKLAGESYCRVFGETFDLDYTVFRYYHVIGPRQDDSDKGGVVPIFIRRVLENKPLIIYGTGEQVRSFTSVFDAVKANIMAVSHPQARQEYFNCASGIQVSIQELAEFILSEMKSNVGIQYTDWRPGDIINFDIENSKIRSLLEMKFNTDWKSVVRKVISSKIEGI